MAVLAKGRLAAAITSVVLLVLLPLLFVGATCAAESFSGRRIRKSAVQQQQQRWEQTNHHERKSFRSPGFRLGRGEVIDTWFRVDMPPGHVALRSLEARLVNEYGNAVPLRETYLNRWGIERYYIIRGSSGSGLDSRSILVPNAGVCQHGFLAQSFGGLGSETRDSNNSIPAPYGVVVGDPKDVPFGFEEAWFLSVHAIDTRGAVNSRECMECVCELYNVTTNLYGDELPVNYEGGMFCCHDGTRCLVQESNQDDNSRRKLFLEYTATWINMPADVIPARIYLLDVTDARTSAEQKPACLLEYTVDQCADEAQNCIHSIESTTVLGSGGIVIFAEGHQRGGGVGITLSKKDGMEICSSVPIYGNGSEAGYVVGMTSCYPDPGNVKVSAREILHLKSSYNNEKRHTGAIGVFRVVVTDTTPQQKDEGLFSQVFLSTATIVAAIVFACMTIWRFQMLRRNTDYVSLDRSSNDRSSLDRPSLGRSSLDRPSPDGLSPDRSSLDRPSPHGPSPDRSSVDRPSPDISL